MPSISRTRLAALMDRETRRFTAERPKSRALFERARSSLLGGVPMNWMVRWSGPFPLFVKEAHGRISRTWTAIATWICAWATPAP